MIRDSFKLIAVFTVILITLTGCSSDSQKKETYLSQAQEFFDSKEYEKAAIQLKNAIQIDNASVKAYTLLSKLYLRTQKPQEAFKTFLRLEQLEPENLDHKLQVASFFLLGKNFTQADQRINQVLDKNPENIQALYLHAGILSAQKKEMAQIEKVYHKILAIDPNQAKAHHVLARIYGSQKDLEKAESSLTQAIELEPNNITFYRSLFGFYLAQRQLDDAQNVLETLISQRPDEAQPIILLANFHLGKKDLRTAEELYKKAIETQPGHLQTYMLLASLYKRQNRLEESEAQIKRALEIEPENAAVKNAYADFHFSNKNVDKAEELVEDILANRPDYPQARLLKGRILAAKKQYNPARDIFLELLKGEPESVLINFLLGSVFYEQKDYKAATPYLTKAIENQPSHIPARMMMANIHFNSNDLTLAQDQAKKVIQLQPANYNANIINGNIELALKQYETAAGIFEKMIKQVPDNPSAYYRLGIVNIQQGKRLKALPLLEKALVLNPNLVDVFSTLIGVLGAENQFDAALEKCDARLAKTEEPPIVRSVVFNLKGDLMMATGKTDAAKHAYQESIFANPGFITPYLTLAKINRRENNIEAAIALYKRLIAKRPEQPAPHSLLGTLYEQQEKYDLARTQYETALKINPDYLPALNNLAFLYADQGIELNKALDLARAAKDKLGRLPAVMDTLGWVYYKKQLYDSALPEFEECVKKEPDNPIFHYHLGLTYNKMGQYLKAETALKKALELQKDFKGAEQAEKVLRQL